MSDNDKPFQDDPDQWYRYVGKIAFGAHREDLIHDAILGVLEQRRHVNPSMHQSQIRFYLSRQMMFRIMESSLRSRTILSFGLAARACKSKRWFHEKIGGCDFLQRAFYRRQRFCSMKSNSHAEVAEFVIADPHLTDAMDVARRKEEHELGRIFIDGDSSGILAERYAGASIEDLARVQKKSRIEIRMAEIAALRKVGAL